MRPLVAVRRAAAFDPAFIDRDPLLWPLARAARALAPLDDFPEADRLGRVFDDVAPVRFVEAAPRRRGGPVDARNLYDARITLDGEVPTRPRCWHDLMNALVWGTFPRAKSALHRRQHQAIAARLVPGSRTLPPTRSSELDALALLDEGGVVVLARETAPPGDRNADADAVRRAIADRAATAVVFGHAIYESLVLGVRPAIVAAVVLASDRPAPSLDGIDGLLAEWLANPATAQTPRELSRIDLADLRAG
jgi:hypothetical protein